MALNKKTVDDINVKGQPFGARGRNATVGSSSGSGGACSMKQRIWISGRTRWRS